MKGDGQPASDVAATLLVVRGDELKGSTVQSDRPLLRPSTPGLVTCHHEAVRGTLVLARFAPVVRERLVRLADGAGRVFQIGGDSSVALTTGRPRKPE